MLVIAVTGLVFSFLTYFSLLPKCGQPSREFIACNSSCSLSALNDVVSVEFHAIQNVVTDRLRYWLKPVKIAEDSRNFYRLFPFMRQGHFSWRNIETYTPLDWGHIGGRCFGHIEFPWLRSPDRDFTRKRNFGDFKVSDDARSRYFPFIVQTSRKVNLFVLPYRDDLRGNDGTYGSFYFFLEQRSLTLNLEIGLIHVAQLLVGDAGIPKSRTEGSKRSNSKSYIQRNFPPWHLVMAALTGLFFISYGWWGVVRRERIFYVMVWIAGCILWTGSVIGFLSWSSTL